MAAKGIASKFLLIVPLILGCFTFLSCSDARDRHDKGMIQHPHSDPYGPKDSTMVQEDTLDQSQPAGNEN